MACEAVGEESRGNEEEGEGEQTLPGLGGGRGIMGSLIKASVGYAVSRGAKIVEAYPVVPEKAWDPRYEVYTGVESTFRRLGFVEAARRSERRIVMRYRVPGSAP